MVNKPFSADSGDKVNGCSKCAESAESDSAYFSMWCAVLHLALENVQKDGFDFILLFVFGSLVVKQRMKVATNLQEIVTVAGIQPSKNFTAYFWTIALIYVLPLPC